MNYPKATQDLIKKINKPNNPYSNLDLGGVLYELDRINLDVGKCWSKMRRVGGLIAVFWWVVALRNLETLEKILTII